MRLSRRGDSLSLMVSRSRITQEEIVMKRASWLAVVLVLLAGAGLAAAQSGPTGLLNGRAVDQSQAAMPGVTVTATNVATNESRTVVTNSEGVYHLAALTVGTYELTFQLEGFREVRRMGVLVEAAVPRTIDVQLEVGGLSEAL